MARPPDETTIWSRQFFTFVAIGLVVAAILVGFFLWWNRRAHLELKGTIQKTRIQATDDNSAVVVFDFRVTNPSEVPFVVRQVDVVYMDEQGRELDGMIAADRDAKRLMDYYAAMGPKYNPTLMARDKIAPRETVDRMVMASFPVSAATLQARKNFIIRIADVDGAVSELSEHPR